MNGTSNKKNKAGYGLGNSYKNKITILHTFPSGFYYKKDSADIEIPVEPEKKEEKDKEGNAVKIQRAKPNEDTVEGQKIVQSGKGSDPFETLNIELTEKEDSNLSGGKEDSEDSQTSSDSPEPKKRLTDKYREEYLRKTELLEQFHKAE